jgi:CubicO group peptidase (beta-lactamase class C family)
MFPGVLLWLLLEVAVPTSASSQTVGQLISDAGVPGLSMAVIRNGEVVEVTALGVRNALAGTPVDADTIFDAASLSKPVFAYAVLQLVDAGASADAALMRHVPDLCKMIHAGENRRHVLSHTSGLPNWRAA